MKIHHFLFFAFGLFLVSCGPGKVQEGEIEYEITYPFIEVSGFMSAILPKTMTLTFKGTKMKTTIARGKIFVTEIITNEADSTVEMRLDFGDKLYYSILTPEDIEKLKLSQPHYDITATDDVDSVKGMWAKKYNVVCKEDSVEHSPAWFTEDLAPTKAYWFSSYHSIAGIPVIYDVERYGIIMHLEAINFTKREVKETEFDRDKSLEEVSFDDYESEVQELFDILMK